ncbi:MAG: TrmH family RNA methyltransferase, partial [Candidatus Woesearchaeota archaeon]
NDGLAIFFGRESHGLTNEELASMDFMINVPTDKSYGVMNLSHSVAIILYELYNTEGTKRRDERYKPLGRKERESIENLYKEIISRLDFETDSKFRIQRVLWQKIIAKSMLSNREGYALMGFLRKIKDRISR